MLPLSTFNSYSPGEDLWFNEKPVLKLDDLEPLYHTSPSISVLISTWNRGAQLARSLECLCRQTFKSFEVLINDDGSTQNLLEYIEPFQKLLKIKYIRSERPTWVSCPSKGFKKLMPLEDGSHVRVIMHPEMMLHPSALSMIYWELHSSLHNTVSNDGKNPFEMRYFRALNNEVSYSDAYYGSDLQYWISLRSGFMTPEFYSKLDTIDWHSRFENIFDVEGFWETGGFAGRNNSQHVNEFPHYPWWFVGAAFKSNPIWDAMHETVGHGVIDMWLCTYRSKHNFIDIVPKSIMCLHQPHVTSAVAPEGEQESATV